VYLFTDVLRIKHWSIAISKASKLETWILWLIRIQIYHIFLFILISITSTFTAKRLWVERNVFTILKYAIPLVFMNNRYRGAVNNTTNNLHDVYRGMKSITTCFGLIWPSSAYIQRVSEICKNYTFMRR
jgi:hypothetical protein